MPRAMRRRRHPRRRRYGRRERRLGRRGCADAAWRTVRITPGSRPVGDRDQHGGGRWRRPSLGSRRRQGAVRAAGAASAARNRSASVIVAADRAGRIARRSRHPAARGPRPARFRRARNRPAGQARPRARGGRATRGDGAVVVGDQPQRMVGAEDQRVAAVEPKRDAALLAFAFALHLDRAEGGRVDLDLELFDRRDEHVAAVGLAAQDGREQPDHRRPADRLALMVPGAVAGDAHRRNGRSARDSTGRPAAGGAGRSAPGARQVEALKLDRGAAFWHCGALYSTDWIASSRRSSQ